MHCQAAFVTVSFPSLCFCDINKSVNNSMQNECTQQINAIDNC